MGKYSGKVLTVFITPSGVRVCEGENRNGNPDVSRFFVVRGVEDYFIQPSSAQAWEIVNMAGLVNAIVDECRTRHTTARRVMVCSDCFGLSTQVNKNAQAGGLKNLMSGDVTQIFKGSGAPKEQALPDQMMSIVQWGELTIDGVVNRISTKTVGDKFLLRSLVQEFYKYGYEVIFISGAQEVLMNFRQTEPASFDSQGKIVFDFDVDVRMTVFLKDIPVEISKVSMLPKEQLIERVRSMLRTAMQSTGRNPRIYLTGSIFEDTVFYSILLDNLEAEGYLVYDLFGRPDIGDSYEDRLAKGEIEPVLTPDYSANLALLMCPYAKLLVTLTPNLSFGDMFQKNSKAVAMLVLGASILMFCASLGVAGMRVWELHEMEANPSQVSTLQSQIGLLNTRQQSLNSTIQTLTQADTTVLELMKFIDTNQSDRVCVVSLDTADMLPDGFNADTSGVSVTADTVIAGEVGGAGATRESIIIRGYAKSGTDAVAYFDRLFRYGLPVDPVLNGVERYSLPNGEVAYVFEIEIGGAVE